MICLLRVSFTLFVKVHDPIKRSLYAIRCIDPNWRRTIHSRSAIDCTQKSLFHVLRFKSCKVGSQVVSTKRHLPPPHIVYWRRFSGSSTYPLWVAIGVEKWRAHDTRKNRNSCPSPNCLCIISRKIKELSFKINYDIFSKTLWLEYSTKPMNKHKFND